MKVKGLKRYWSGGIYYVYHRRTNTRLPADLPEDDPAFLDAYLAAETGLAANAKARTEVQRGTVEDIARRYMASHEFKSLAKSYQDVRRRDLDRLLREKQGLIARLQFRAIRDVHIMTQMEGMQPNPANERLKTWRALGAFAVRWKVVTIDPSRTVSRVRTPKTDGHTPWTLPQIAQFRERWTYGTKQRLGFEICFWFGCRISDAVALGEKDLTADGWFEFNQKKTKGEVAVPFNRSLPRFAVPEDLDHLKRAIGAMNRRGETFLETEYGEQRSAKAAPRWFSEAAKMAGLPEGLTSHGLRKSRMILHAERGATMKQIGAWSGHDSLKEIERYTRKADKKRLLTPSALETGEFY